MNLFGPLISKSGRPFTDAALITGLTERKESALKALIESCGPYVYGRAKQIVGDAQLAQEIAQDALLVMWWNPERFDPAEGTLRAFLMEVARLEAIDVVRREDAIASRDSLPVEGGELTDCRSADKGVAEGIDVPGPLSALPRGQRQALLLAYFQGLTYPQVSAVLEVPEVTVKSRIRDGLIKLRATPGTPGTA